MFIKQEATIGTSKQVNEVGGSIVMKLRPEINEVKQTRLKFPVGSLMSMRWGNVRQSVLLYNT